MKSLTNIGGYEKATTALLIAPVSGAGLLRLVFFRERFLHSSKEVKILRLREVRRKEEDFEDGDDLDASELGVFEASVLGRLTHNKVMRYNGLRERFTLYTRGKGGSEIWEERKKDAGGYIVYYYGSPFNQGMWLHRPNCSPVLYTSVG